MATVEMRSTVYMILIILDLGSPCKIPGHAVAGHAGFALPECDKQVFKSETVLCLFESGIEKPVFLFSVLCGLDNCIC